MGVLKMNSSVSNYVKKRNSWRRKDKNELYVMRGFLILCFSFLQCDIKEFYFQQKKNREKNSTFLTLHGKSKSSLSRKLVCIFPFCMEEVLHQTIKELPI